MHGEIVIGTKLKTEDFESALKTLEDKAEKAGKKIDSGELRQALYNTIEDAENKMQEIEPLAQRYGELLERYLSLTSQNKGSLMFESDKKEAEELKQQLQEIVAQIEKITGEKISIAGITDIKPQLNGIKNKLDDIGKSTRHIIDRITKWGLALIGIRSAYSFITSSMSTLSQYDEQLAVNIKYIRYLIASTLKPIIENLIQLVYKLLAYVNYIAQAWFGINLFANASTKAFEKQNKTLNSSVKQAKQLQKTLAGFDEMNILQENGNVTSGGGGGGTSDIEPLPNFPKMEDVKIPSWLEWIKEHKDEIIEAIIGIVGALAGLKLGLSGIQSLGIGLALIGIYYTMKKVKDFLNDPTFENFIGILKGIALIVAGIALAFATWPVALGAVVALIILLIVENFDKIKELFDKGIKWLDKNVLGKLRELFGPLGDILYLPIKYFAELARNTFETFYGGIKKVIEGVMKIFRGEFFNGIKEIFGSLINIMTAPLQAFIKAVKKVWDQIKGSVNYWAEKFKEKFDEIKNKITKPFTDFIDTIKGLWNKVKEPIEKFVNNINKELSKINPVNILGDVGKASLGIIGTGWNKIKSVFGFAKGGIVVPRLASGGVINQPGRGVPLASAIGGERGAEGVIPLTDSQQMALLGEAIGRYITINANITNTMNGRVISRELQKVQNENNFAFNR